MGRNRVRKLIGGAVALAVVVTSYSASGAAIAGQEAQPGVAIQDVTALAEVLPPADRNPNRPGIQLNVPYYSEPEFLLVNERNRWNVRNRPAGTIAAGYGHQDGVSHDALMATARYPKQAAPTTTYGTLPANNIWDLDPEDVSYFSADTQTSDRSLILRDRSYYVTRYESGVIGIDGPVETDLDRRMVFGSPAAGVTYVGATVETDDAKTNTFTALLVRSDGKIMRYERSPTGASITPAFDLGQGAIAAVGRNISHFEKAPRAPLGGVDSNRSAFGYPDTTTMLLVLRADGEFVPLKVDGIVEQLPLLSTIAPSLRASNLGASDNTSLDFDFGCMWTAAELAVTPYTGPVASYLRCPFGSRVDGGVDRVGTGRIVVSLASGGAGVQVFTAGDNITETRQDAYQVIKESDTATTCQSQGPPGSTDARVVAGVAYVACVQQGYKQIGDTITTYVYPQSMTEVRRIGWPARSRQVTTQNTGPFIRADFDEMAQPDVGENWTASKPTEAVYDRWSAPVIQLQFPCAELLARPSRSGTSLDDCDPSTGTPTGAQGPDGKVNVSPPPNWLSYTLANYRSVGPGNYELVVTTVPADQLPIDRTVATTDTPPPFGDIGYDRENFQFSVGAERYLASDLGALNAGEDVDVSTFDKYSLGDNPSTYGSPIFLAQVPRMGPTQLEIELTSTASRVDISPSLPVAVLQAPPSVGGLSQQDDFTPEFAISKGGGTGDTSGTTTSLGGHIEGAVVATVGAGALGTNARAGGGIGFGVGWNNSSESSITKSVELTRTEGYGGAFDETAIVTRAFKEYVWDGVVLHDPTGVSTGESFEYRIPGEELITSRTLSALATKAPGLYGPQGAYTKSIKRITNNYSIGNPATYYGGASTATPGSILESNGGPCIGGYSSGAIPTDLGAPLAAPVRPENPFVEETAEPPTGPNVVTSAQHQVSVGNALTETSTIDITASTTRSALATKAFDWSVSAIGKYESEVDLGVSAKFEVEVRAGINGEYTSSAGIEDSLAEGSAITATMGNIPFSTADVGSWVANEAYNWRMYFCKARLGPAGLNTSVWVQGFVVEGYNGTGGLTDLSPATVTSPKGGAYVPGTDGGALTGVSTPCPTTPDPSQVEFRWDHPAGSMKRYALEVFDGTTGEESTYEVAQWAEPDDFHQQVKRDPSDDGPGLADRVSCAAISTSQLAADHLLSWRLVAQGFSQNEVTSPWGYFRPVGPDGPTATSVSVVDARLVSEGETAAFKVKLDSAATKTVSVSVATASKTARAGRDFRSKSVTLQFEAGQRVKTVRVRTLRDQVREDRETFLLKVTRSGSLVVTGGTATGRIANRR